MNTETNNDAGEGRVPRLVRHLDPADIAGLSAKDLKYQVNYWKHIARMRFMEGWADGFPPWRPIGELGEIAYMEDGSRRWTLKAGWEDMRMFLVYLANGDVETHFAYIDDSGTLCDHNGDDVGWIWSDAEYFMDIPARPSLSNVKHIRR